MHTTVILATENLTRRSQRGTTHLRSGLSIHSRFIASNSTLSHQRPGEPYTGELTNGARSSIEVWGSEDVSRRPVRTSISLIPGCRWGSIFLYVYTGRIMFAAVGWRDVPSKAKETQDDSPDRLYVPPPGAVAGDPCSPKSIYRLAEKVCAVLPLRLCSYRSAFHSGRFD